MSYMSRKRLLPPSAAAPGSAVLRSGAVAAGHALCQSAGLEKLLHAGDAALFHAELWPRVGFQESARRAPEGAHRDALFLRDGRTPPPGLRWRPLNPGVELVTRGFEEEPLQHLAVALGTPSRFRAQVLTSKIGMDATCLPPPNDPAPPPQGLWRLGPGKIRRAPAVGCSAWFGGFPATRGTPHQPATPPTTRRHCHAGDNTLSPTSVPGFGLPNDPAPPHRAGRPGPTQKTNEAVSAAAPGSAEDCYAQDT